MSKSEVSFPERFSDPHIRRVITSSFGIPPRKLEPCPLDIADPNARLIPFVEPKRPDWHRVSQISAVSEMKGRWANFGPVNEAFGRLVWLISELPSSRCAVPTSSGTAALHAIAGMYAARDGAPLTWAISAFGFYSSAIGPLAAKVRMFDCDYSGFLDLDQVESASPAEWDGMIVTNTFGLATKLDRYVDFCRQRGKPLIIDSALAFPPLPHKDHYADVMLSFHHTKPWGFGEGGCAIVARENAPLMHSLLNFGIGADEAVRPFAMNGKMSDVSAALILERLERITSWGPLYLLQRKRIAEMIAAAGLRLLGSPPRNAVTGHLPVLAPWPINEVSLPQARFFVSKYYRPLAPGFAVAADLFSRMVNVPCHPAMAAISDEELEMFFGALKWAR